MCSGSLALTWSESKVFIWAYENPHYTPLPHCPLRSASLVPLVPQCPPHPQTVGHRDQGAKRVIQTPKWPTPASPARSLPNYHLSVRPTLSTRPYLFTPLYFDRHHLLIGFIIYSLSATTPLCTHTRSMRVVSTPLPSTHLFSAIFQTPRTCQI